MIVKGVKFNGISVDTVNGKPIRAVIKRGREYEIKDRSTFELLVEDTTEKPQIRVTGIDDCVITVNWGDSVETYEVAANDYTFLRKSTPYATTGEYIVTIKSKGEFEYSGTCTYDRLFSYGYSVAGGFTILNAEIIGDASTAKFLINEQKQLSDLVFINVKSLSDIWCTGSSKIKNLTLPSTLSSYGGSLSGSITNIYYEGLLEDWCKINFNSSPCISANTYNLYLKFQGYDWYKPTAIVIPDTITQIKDYTFASLSQLTNVLIPESVTSIGNKAFYYCTSLTSIDIPDSVQQLGNQAFYHCDKLSSVRLPNSITQIPSNCFYACSKLRTIEIPASVFNIDRYALASCYEITFNGSIPPTIASNSITKRDGLQIIVPTGYGEVYKTWDDVWSTYADYIIERGE